MHCQSCLRSIQAVLTHELSENRNDEFSSIIHESLPDLYWSGRKGCWICKQILQSLHERFYPDDIYSSTEEDDLSLYAEVPSKFREARNTVVQLQIYHPSRGIKDPYYHLSLRAIEGSESKNLAYREINLHLSTNSSYETTMDTPLRTHLSSGHTQPMLISKLWNHWFQTCSESHENCRALNNELPPFAPDRLIEISTEDNGDSFTWRLVSRDDISNVQYLTLSHCWGSSTHASLTSSNISARLKFRPYSELPKTFQDTFFVTFSLGFRFIWIDSLCIIQDDLVDWKSQASMMGTIYKNARCNIAATWAADGDDGCFTKKKPIIVTLDLGLGRPTECQVQRSQLYYDDLMEAPLNTRGWVAQERFLARKQLSFAKSQVYWECRELVASEQYPGGIPESLTDLSPYNQAIPPTGKPSLDYTTEADIHDAWAALVDFYSACEFSRLSDKMIALAGLAEEMRGKTGDIYLAGLWKKDLRSQLCWSTDFDVRRRENRSTMQMYLAPTWSWVNVDGPVMSDMNYTGVVPGQTWCVEVLDASVRSEHVSELHSFIGSNLVLRGIAVWARAVHMGNHVGVDALGNWVLHPTETSDKFQSLLLGHVEIHWDENMSGPDNELERWPIFLEQRASDLLFLFVSMHDDNNVAQGLILRRLSGTVHGVVFVRMGVFFIYSSGFYDMFQPGRRNSSNESTVGDIDLDNTAYLGFVHTVTVI